MYLQELRWIIGRYTLKQLSWVCTAQWGGAVEMCLKTKHMDRCNKCFGWVHDTCVSLNMLNYFFSANVMSIWGHASVTLPGVLQTNVGHSNFRYV